jgi:hypothetical protein
MFTRNQIDRLFGVQLILTKMHFIVLNHSISDRERRNNPALRNQVAKILHQMELIEELNRKFECE